MTVLVAMAGAGRELNIDLLGKTEVARLQEDGTTDALRIT
jgi:hypothetical protein